MKLRILHISDTHISNFGQFDKKAFNKFLETVDKLEQKPDLIIHSGDVVDNGVLTEYELAKDYLKSLNYKLLICPGNHDDRNGGGTLFAEFFGPADFEYEIGRFKLFIMNSPQPDRDEGRLGRRRQFYLQQRLSEIGDSYFKIIVFHHHLIPVPYSGREVNVLEDAGDVLELVLRNNVNLVLMGHRHVPWSIKINNTVLVNAGTVSCLRTRGRFGNSFNFISIDEENIYIEEIKVDGKKGMLTGYKTKSILKA